MPFINNKIPHFMEGKITELEFAFESVFESEFSPHDLIKKL